jgi:hypothetical protein
LYNRQQPSDVSRVAATAAVLNRASSTDAILTSVIFMMQASNSRGGPSTPQHTVSEVEEKVDPLTFKSA